MENPIKMDDLGVPLFLETCILNALVTQFTHFSHEVLLQEKSSQALQV